LADPRQRGRKVQPGVDLVEQKKVPFARAPQLATNVVARLGVLERAVRRSGARTFSTAGGLNSRAKEPNRRIGEILRF
jgi:hypothetical protein